MNKETILIEIQEIFRTVFDDENIVLSASTTSDDIEDWDSLEQINLLVAIEKHFSVKFALDDVHELADISAICNLVELALNK